MSLFYGVAQTGGSLAFILSMDHADGDVELSTCDSETRGLIWYQMVLVTELMIFSVRAPSFFLYSIPSLYLLGSVIVTCIGGAFIAVYASDLRWANVGWIALLNLGMLVIVDLLKIWVRWTIDDIPGEVISTDELLEVPPIEKTEVQKHMEKKMRYVVHNESILPPEDRQHVVRTRRRAVSGLDGFFSDIRGSVLNEGFISKSQEKRLIAGMSQDRAPRYKQRSSPI